MPSGAAAVNLSKRSPVPSIPGNTTTASCFTWHSIPRGRSKNKSGCSETATPAIGEGPSFELAPSKGERGLSLCHALGAFPSSSAGSNAFKLSDPTTTRTSLIWVAISIKASSS
jgi:hypothetical protein